MEDYNDATGLPNPNGNKAAPTASHTTPTVDKSQEPSYIEFSIETPTNPAPSSTPSRIRHEQGRAARIRPLDLLIILHLCVSHMDSWTTETGTGTFWNQMAEKFLRASPMRTTISGQAIKKNVLRCISRRRNMVPFASLSGEAGELADQLIEHIDCIKEKPAITRRKREMEIFRRMNQYRLMELRAAESSQPIDTPMNRDSSETSESLPAFPGHAERIPIPSPGASQPSQSERLALALEQLLENMNASSKMNSSDTNLLERVTRAEESINELKGQMESIKRQVEGIQRQMEGVSGRASHLMALFNQSPH